MKKTIAILLSLLMFICLVACGNSSNQTDNPSAEKHSVENNTTAEAATVSGNADKKETPSASEPQTKITDNSKEQGNKVLVAYFSATNNTEGVAKHIAKGLDADLYEIIPKDSYTSADLNYNDNNSRTTLEMNDPNIRPAISGSVENMEQYDIVFIGYPIWWGQAPRIISTFMESYDFTGKTIVPFCTSSSSGIGSSATNLKGLASGATWLSGQRFSGSDSSDTVMKWVNSLGLDF